MTKTDQTLQQQPPSFKKKVREWLRAHVGEPVGPHGYHVPFPEMKRIHRPMCYEHGDRPATHRMEGFFMDASFVEIPLCDDCVAAASRFLAKRRAEIVRTDESRRSARRRKD